MKNSCASSEPTPHEALDLPDWPAADDSAGRVLVEPAFALYERYLAEMPEVVQRLRSQCGTPCPVEFVLT